MGRYSSKTDEMRCAYCGVKRRWDTTHFPDRSVAKCTWCFMDDADESGSPGADR